LLNEDGRVSVDNLPALDLRQGTVYVDIAHLRSERHREAFAAIFVRVLAENERLLSTAALVEVRPGGVLTSVITMPTPMTIVASQAESVAFALYDALVEHVELTLRWPSGTSRLTVRFDNPEFKIEGPGGPTKG
jgi:hypothetical protein